MTKKSNHKPILGFSDTQTVMLDLDNTSFKSALYWAKRTMNYHKLEGLLILKSSTKCYHVVFNRAVCWSENMRIVAWVSLLSRNEKLKTYLIMQCIKESSTLRISNKGEKASPRIVFRFGKQDKQVKEYLSYRRRIKRIIRNMQNRQQEKIET